MGRRWWWLATLALARAGLVFRRAYCPRATCAAARASLLTGMRPETHGVRDLRQHYRDRLPEVVSLPEFFRAHGWFTWALGKLEHGRGEREDERAWSRAAWRPAGWQRWYAEPEHRARVAQLEPGAQVFAWEAPDVADEELPDGRIAAEAEASLRVAPREPFFLGVGFLKPHLPFVAPRRYWDLYPEVSLDLLGRRER